MRQEWVHQLRRKGLQSGVVGHTLFVDCPFCVSMGTTRDTRQRLGIEIVGGHGHVPVGMGFCFNCGYRSKKALTEVLGVDPVFVKEPEEAKSSIARFARLLRGINFALCRF